MNTTQPALDYELFLTRDCSRGTAPLWFIEIWGRGE